MAYIHSVDKSLIPTVNIFGVNIAAINMPWLLRFMKRNIKKLSGDYICVSNVHTTVMAGESEKYCKVQNGGILAIPDGGPLSVVGRKRGASGMRRTTGPSFMDELLKAGCYRHYFFGSTPETLTKMCERIKRDYPQSTIVGMYSPPFGPLSEDEDKRIIDCINKTNPDVIWVGLGAPKQERWMARHQGKVKGLMVGVGAGFDYYAGNIKRAPQWMQNCNLEWLYRLYQDPKRLFKRYLITNTKFVWNVMIKGK